MHPRPPPPNFSQKPAQPPPDTPLPSFGLYEILLENIQFDRESGVHESIHDLLHSPGPLGMKVRRILPHLMPVMIRLEKLTLLNLLLQNDVAIAPEAVRAAAEQPFEEAKMYLDLLFTHGWDINKALGATEPPVLRQLKVHSVALKRPRLLHWLLAKGADPNVSCEQLDITSLTVAVHQQDFEVVKLLLQHAEHRQNGYLVHSALQRANDAEALEMLRLLHRYRKPIDEIQWQDKKSIVYRGAFACGTPLYWACRWAKWQFALALVTLGANRDQACVKDGQCVGQTPREILVEEGAAFAAELAQGLCVAGGEDLL
ncbi:hypothetical protein LTS09_014533 [Friedmanniomyces endolithicus]|nr:hypothetical protein LTS09_014533 [Friedmanniomyces endolithicus]